jgi:hypothetical protein
VAHQRMPYRVLLPVVFGLVSVGLIGLAVHEDVACVGYDAGRPFWPCEAPSALLNLLSLPGIALFLVIFRWWHGYGLVRYLAEWPFVLVWWWFAGTRLDFGLLGTGQYRWRKTCSAGLLGVALALVALAVENVREDLAWHRQYPDASITRTVGAAFLLVWVVALTLACVFAAVRLWRGENGSAGKVLLSRSTLLCTVAGGMIYVLGLAGLMLHMRARERRLEAEYAQHQTSVEGRILDESGSAVKGIEVQLVPVFKAGDAKWAATARAWTDEHGAYRLTPDEAGEYLLGAMIDEAPYASQPFLTRYYPGTNDVSNSTSIKLVDEQHVRVDIMRLNRIPLVRVPVTVVWADGRPEPSASILFQNPLFPHEPGIGSASVFPDGDGRIPLPGGYEYVALASVQCDAGAKIESHETDRVPLSTKADADLSRQIRLTLPGPECKLWHPR